MLSHRRCHRRDLLSIRSVFYLNRSLININLRSNDESLLTTIDKRTIRRRTIQLYNFRRTTNRLRTYGIPRATLTLKNTKNNNVPSNHRRRVNILSTLNKIFRRTRHATMLVNRRRRVYHQTMTIKTSTIRLRTKRRTTRSRTINRVTTITSRTRLLTHRHTPTLSSNRRIHRRLAKIDVIHRTVSSKSTHGLDRLFRVTLTMNTPSGTIVVTTRRPNNVLRQLTTTKLRLNNNVRMITRTTRLMSTRLRTNTNANKIFQRRRDSTLTLRREFNTSNLLPDFRLVNRVGSINRLIENRITRFRRVLRTYSSILLKSVSTEALPEVSDTLSAS